jgi:hypothetical protein
MLDFYLQFIVQLEKPATQKCHYIVHNWTTPILELMHLEEGNVGKKIASKVLETFVV